MFLLPDLLPLGNHHFHCVCLFSRHLGAIEANLQSTEGRCTFETVLLLDSTAAIAGGADWGC